MKKNTITFLIAASAVTLMAGCAGGAKSSAAQTETAENDAQVYEETDTETAQAADTEIFSWLPEDVVREKSETEPNDELRKLIIDYYEITDYELADSRYYYSYVDLDSDGTNEIFAVVVGSYTSGTGGSSALWCEEQDGSLTVKQAFTQINMPIIVVDNEEGGPKDLILERMGGGAEAEFVKLTCKDGVYANVSDGEPAGDLENVQGVAILCNDLAEDMETGNYLTLGQMD